MPRGCLPLPGSQPVPRAVRPRTPQRSPSRVVTAPCWSCPPVDALRR